MYLSYRHLSLGAWVRISLLTPLALAMLLPPMAASADTEPRYVVFQFQGMENDAPVQPNLPSLVGELEEAFGAQPPEAARHAGFTPGLLFSLNLPIDVLQSRVNQALDVAEESGMPVFFHLDDLHFWWNQKDLHADPQAVEWSDFPEEGETHGPIIERYWLNWGSWQVFDAPPPNFESPRFRAFVAEQLTEGVGKPIAERLAKWRAEGREYLFAGIAVGNETEVPYDLRPLQHTPAGLEPAGHDANKQPPESVTMRRDEMTRGGYAALYMRGYTREKVRELAEQREVSEDEVITELRHEAAHDYAAFRCKTLHETGIPRTRIYTHFVSAMRPMVEKHLDEMMLDRFPPVSASVNPYSRPGYTLTRDSVDLPDLVAKIRASREEVTELGAAWAGVETYATTSQPGRPQTREEYEAYLGGLFAHEMRLINIYGWNVPKEGPSAPFSVKNAPGVIEAVQNWVNGKELPTDWEGAAGESAPAFGAIRLGPKMQQLEGALQRLEDAGGDPKAIRRMLEPLQSLVAEGKLDEAEALLDKALQQTHKALDVDMPAAQEAPAPPAAFQQKMQRVHEAVQAWREAGGDPVALGALAGKVEPLIKEGDFEKAEQVLEEILALVKADSTANAGEHKSPSAGYAADQTYGQTQSVVAEAAPDEPKYLIFWHPMHQVGELVERIGEKGDGKTRLLGFGVPTSTFELEHELPERIHNAFQAAREHGVAVMLHFDFHLFWQSRPDLWNWFDPDKPGYDPDNKYNVEWHGWDGPPNKAHYLNWGVLERIAPHMCLTSEEVRTEVARIVSEVIAPALREELAALRGEGKEALFAGVLVGSEPSIADYSNPSMEQAAMMEEDGVPAGPLGFRALLDRGFNAANPPEDIHQALAHIVQESVAFWCRQFVEAGIPPSKLYPHVAAPAPVEHMHAPIWTAFNAYSRPGWTTYPVMRLEQDFSALYDALAEHGNPPWAGVEANVGLPGAAVDWETYLGWHYNHGAVIVGVNVGATGEELPKRLSESAFGEEALAAYAKFLNGEELQEKEVTADSPQLRIQKKMLRVRDGVAHWHAEGKDPSAVVGLMEKAQPLADAGKLDELEALLNQALNMLGGTGGAPAASPEGGSGRP